MKAKSGYINSDYSDVMYRVYIWGFPCLDYSFDVLISLIGNVSLYNWFPIVIYLLSYFMFIHAHVHDTHFLYTCICYARRLALLMYSLGLLTSLDSHVQILEPGSWWLGCSRSERAADPPVVVRAQSKLRRRRSSSSHLMMYWVLPLSLIRASV